MKKLLKAHSLILLMLLLLCLPLQASAAAPKNKLVTKNGYTYYYNSKRKLAKSTFVTVKGKKYYFDRNGRMVKNKLFKIGSKTYYAGTSGALVKNRIITINGKKYYFNKSGHQTFQWVSLNGRRYYFLKEGGFYTNCWKKIGSYTYHFNASGYMDKNKWVDSYFIDQSGHRTSIKIDSSIKSNTYKKISMKNIRQNPQLPTGCESVALTMVLKHYGFSLGKTTIASKYMPRSSTGNFVTAFAGNPFTPSGCGIYAPGLKNTANKYLKAKRSSKRAYDISGMTLSSLYRFIDAGTPVIVWNSMYMYNPVASFSRTVSGKRWTFYAYEHCVVLCGYDKKRGRVLINDPLSGLVWRNAKSFERIYNKLGKMAIVIR